MDPAAASPASTTTGQALLLATLARTCVIELGDRERRLVRKELVLPAVFLGEGGRPFIPPRMNGRPTTTLSRSCPPFTQAGLYRLD
jgi:hypothetical protein